jgi:Protein kinase domain
MEFDWNSLKPGREIAPSQMTLVREIASMFLAAGKGASIHEKNRQLKGERRFLGEVQQLGFIQYDRNRCLPRFPALYFVEGPTRAIYAKYLDNIFGAISALFEERGPSRLAIGDVASRTAEIIKERGFEEIPRGVPAEVYFYRATLFLRDFPASVSAEESSDFNIPVGSVVPTDRMYDFVDLNDAWQTELQNPRGRPAYLGPVPVAAQQIEPLSVISPSPPQEVVSVDPKMKWVKVLTEPLGRGGQSTVYLVRRPEREEVRQRSLKILRDLSGRAFSDGSAWDFARAAMEVAREDLPSELAAFKVFDPRGAGAEAEQHALDRLRNEMKVLKENRPGLLKLLDANESEKWIVTEYCAKGTLDMHLSRYKGDAKHALMAFRALAKTVAELHKENIVHRDIKPQNIFVGADDELLLGDFGIVFLPNAGERLSFAGESVGPRDFMPPWVFFDDRPDIKPNFDVYMLGKVLWCMVSGRSKLHREDFLDPRLNVVNLCPTDPNLCLINEILKKCVVTRENECLSSAADLVSIVTDCLRIIERGGQLWGENVYKPCRICGVGVYKQLVLPTGVTGDPKVGLQMAGMPIQLGLFICSHCGHAQFFR